MQVLKAIHIRENVRWTSFQYSTDFHIYTWHGSYVVIDDDAAIWFVDSPSAGMIDHCDSFIYGNDRYYMYLRRDGCVSCHSDTTKISRILLSESVGDVVEWGRLYVKNVRHKGDTTRLTALSRRLIVDILIQWS